MKLGGSLKKDMYSISEISADNGLSIEKKWEASGFSQPESVLSIPMHPWLYVSNVNGEDAGGYISRMALDGTVDDFKWVDGIVPFNDGYIISDPMAGKLFYVTEDSRQKIASDLGSIADIGYDANKQVIYAPLIFGNKVIAYRLTSEG
jgi:hypothetical protein